MLILSEKVSRRGDFMVENGPDYLKLTIRFNREKSAGSGIRILLWERSLFSGDPGDGKLANDVEPDCRTVKSRAVAE